jgi:hypothetical protein
MKRCKDIANAQRLHDDCAAVAAKAQRQASAHANKQAALLCQEDEVHTQVFTSTAATRSCQMAAIHAALPQYEKSWNAYIAWMAEHDAQNGSQDGTVVEAAKHTPALAERVSANNSCHYGYNGVIIPPPCFTTFVCAVLSTMGGNTPILWQCIIAGAKKHFKGHTYPQQPKKVYSLAWGVVAHPIDASARSARPHVGR